MSFEEEWMRQKLRGVVTDLENAADPHNGNGLTAEEKASLKSAKDLIRVVLQGAEDRA